MRQDVEVVVGGSGDYELALMRMATDLRIHENFKLVGIGRGNDLVEIHRKASILQLLLTWENLGPVVAETLSNRTPCVVTANRVLKEFTNEGGCYGIENPSDAKRLADLIPR
jgi:glycosyltransferase involved in cell wall biosynthesis